MNGIVACAAAIALVCLASTAGAAEAFTQEKGQVSVHLAGGIYMGDGDLNPYGVGLGARGGYTLHPGIYVGGLFDFFLGETDDTSVFGQTAEASANAWLIQAEVGYDIGVSPTIVLRPKAGLGVTTIESEACATVTVPPFVPPQTACSDDSDGEFSFALGLEAPIAFNGIFIAPEFRFNIVDDASGLILAVGVGAAF
jgi:hypothetical protein